MQFNRLDDTIAVAPQITVQDMDAIRDAGFQAIICNRPDGEGFGQPGFAEIEAAAQKAGLQARYVPLGGGMMPHAVAGDFAAAMKELPGPVLAYCASGSRATMLWQLSQALA